MVECQQRQVQEVSHTNNDVVKGETRQVRPKNDEVLGSYATSRFSFGERAELACTCFSQSRDAAAKKCAIKRSMQVCQHFLTIQQPMESIVRTDPGLSREEMERNVRGN